MLHYDSNATAQQRLDRFLAESFVPGPSLPFSFTYKGVSSRELLPSWKYEKTDSGVSFTAPDGLAAHVDIRTFEDFAAVEWLLHFENTGSETSGLIEEVNALDLFVAAAPFRTAGTQQYGALDNILYYNGGSDCKADDFIPCQEILHYISVREEMDFGSMQGRPTSGSHGSFPYFNMKTLDQGVIFAIGWSGQWHMKLRTRQHETPDGPTCFSFTGGMPGVSTVLYPGEKIRTARILMLPWKGEVEDANNLSRRFLLKYHTPHVDGRPAVLPFSLCAWGSTAAENMADIDAGAASGLPVDTFWVDAGWYGPAGTQCANSRHNDWSDHVGWYSHDPSRYPEGLGQVGRYAHDHGMRFLLWLEPDRAVEGTPSIAAHPENYLAYPIGNSHMLNLGLESAYQWALEMLSEKIESYHMDVLRIDYNVGPLDSWLANDVEGRRGITEIRAVENFYRLWAELRARFPHLLIDNCASGGRRLDFEANTYSVSLFRTDYLCYADSNAVGNQLQTAGMAPWVPLNGLQFTKPLTWYNFVSYIAPGFGISPRAVARAAKDPQVAAFMRRMMATMVRVRPLMTGDFYLFTGATLNEKDWFAYQVHQPECDCGYVVSARRAECPMGMATYQLKGLDAAAGYQLQDAETDEILGTFTGAQLMGEGLTVTLPQKESASLIFVSRVV